MADLFLHDAPDTTAVLGPTRRDSSSATRVVTPSGNEVGIVLGVVAAAAYSALALVKFYAMGAGVDLAIYTQAVAHYTNAQVPWSSMKAVTGFNLVGEHFSPAVAVIAPFYKLWPHTETLLVAQVVLIGVNAGLITAAGVGSCGARIGVGVGIVYALGWETQGVASFDFNEVAFALSLLAICYIRLRRREFVAAALWAPPLMLVKEDSVFLVLGIALVLLDYGRWRWSAALIAYAIGTFAFIVGWLIPHLSYSGR